MGKVSPPKRMKESATHLNHQATNALAEQPFPAIKNLEVQAHPDGKITLLGSISSHEEKLLASLRLRRITGCTCVDNCLSIQPLPGTSCCAVTADARLTVRAEKAAPTPSKVTSAEPTAPKPPAPMPRLSKEVSAPVKIVPVSAVAKPTAQMHVDPAVTRAVFEVKPAAGFVVKPVSTSLETPSCAGAAAACEPTKLPAMKCVIPVETALPTTPNTAPKSSAVAVANAAEVTAEPRKISPASPEVAAMPCIVATPAGLEFRSSAGTRPAEPQAVGTVVAKPVEAKPAVAEGRHETVAAAPASNDAATPAEEPAPGSLGDWYRNRIAQECGLDVECVGVTFPTHTDIAVTLRIVDRSTAGRLCTKVRPHSRVGPYHVKLGVETPPR